LNFAQASLTEQACNVSQCISEAKQQWAGAVQEAVYYHAKLTALESSSEGEVQLQHEHLTELKQQLSATLAVQAEQPEQDQCLITVISKTAAWSFDVFGSFQRLKDPKRCIFGKIVVILSEEGTFSLKDVPWSLKDVCGSFKVFINLSFSDHSYKFTQNIALYFHYSIQMSLHIQAGNSITLSNLPMAAPTHLLRPTSILI
jgi:hypothetical protein